MKHHFHRLPAMLLCLLLACFGASSRQGSAQPASPVIGKIRIGTGPFGVSPQSVAVNPANGCVYIANFDSNDVTVLDGESHRVLATVSVGDQPIAIAVNWYHEKIYVANLGSNDVSVIDARFHQLLGTIPVGWQPTGIAVEPFGDEVYVSCFLSSSVDVIDGLNGVVVRSIPTGGFPAGMVFAGRLYVANFGGSSISVISLVSHQEIARIPTSNFPEHLALNDTGTRIYVTYYDTNKVDVFNAQTYAPVASIPITNSGGSHPLAMNGVTGTLYVADQWGDRVEIINAATHQVTASVATSSMPSGIGIGSNQNRFYVAAQGSNSIQIFNGANLELLAELSPHVFPVHMVADTFNGWAYVTSESDDLVRVLDLFFREEYYPLPTGIRGGKLAFNSLFNLLYVGGENSLCVIDLNTGIISATRPVFQGVTGLFFDSRTNTLYVTHRNTDSMDVFDGATLNLLATARTGGSPAGVAAHPLGSALLVANTADNTLSVLDGSTFTETDTITVGISPHHIAVNELTGFIYVNNRDQQSVSEIDPTTHRVSRIFPGIPSTLGGYRVDPVTNRLYVPDGQRSLLRVDLNTGLPLAAIPVGSLPMGVIGDDFFRLTYVLNSGNDTISVVDDAPPLPRLFAVSPTTVAAGDPDFVLTLEGSGFTPSSSSLAGSMVEWDGTLLDTTFVSETQIQATISAARIAVPKTVAVRVYNPSVTGDYSNPMQVDILTRISGTVTLPGCVAPAQMITFVLSPSDNSESLTRTVRLNSDGTFSLNNIPSKQYSLTVKGSKWLQRRLASVNTSAGSVRNLHLTLLPGDANDDNIVDVDDFALLADTFGLAEGETGFNPSADFTCDGIVDVDDFALLADNFGVEGD
jgi:YVTN family beta-propeller protein